MKQIIFFAVIFCLVFFSTTQVDAGVASGKKILYVPIDTRPCNYNQVAEVAEKLGYEVLMPPNEILGHEKFYGDPEKIWQWANDNAAGVQAAVISTDAMIYGSLVGSRQHNLSAEEILNRAKNFEQFKKNFPYLPIYAFGTIMRTPYEGTANTTLESEYYQKYGKAFFELTALKDKEEIKKLSRKEKKTIAWLDYYIPAEYKEDWFARRNKNLDANKYFVDLTKSGALEYFLVGCDDNAPYSQTHLESRHLAEYVGKDFSRTQIQVMSGADELGMLMVSRAINKDLNEIPFVKTFYSEGSGGETVPNYCNEKISKDIESAIFAAGGLPIPSAERADFVLAVNTNFDGKTFEAMSAKNTLTETKSTKNFLKLLNNLLEKNYPVGVVDISFANGADNSVMEQMKNQNLQFKIQAYGGWNTATNSSGFLIGAGVFTKFLTERDKNLLLLTRYFDDWAYQANVRPFLQENINNFSGEGAPFHLDEKIPAVKLKADEMLKNFAEKNFRLPKNSSLKNISANFTWNRLFESDISFDFEE